MGLTHSLRARRRIAHHARPRRRLFSGTTTRERGATLIEAGIVTPIFFLLILGLIDGSYALFGDHVVRGAAASGARTASALANEPEADFHVLAAVRRDVSTIGRHNLVRVVVYKAGRLGDPPPTSCRTGSPQPGICNVYDGTDLDLDPDPATYDFCGGGSPSHYWCPPSRATTLNENSAPPRFPDYVGVWVQVRHEPIVGLIIPADRYVTHQMVLRIEPRNTE